FTSVLDSHLKTRCPCLLLTVPVPSQSHSLSLHDALPISLWQASQPKRLLPTPSRSSIGMGPRNSMVRYEMHLRASRTYGASKASDRKSTRLNSSHVEISYAVFCLKKKTTQTISSGRSIAS